MKKILTETVLPSLSVVLVAYRSREDLERCLPTLYRETTLDMEVIVVDNHPGDGTAAWLASSYPQVRVLTSPANGGYAGGNNLGLRAARGAFVLILNPDTKLHRGALRTLYSAARAHPGALITAKLLRPEGRINACGLRLHYTGLSSCRGLGEPAGAYAGLHPAPLLSGAAFIAPKAVLEALGGFSEAHFMYLEDVDLSLRAKVMGFQILCAGDAHITHDYDLAMTPEKFYWLERNRLLTLLRVYELRTLRQAVPALVLTEFLTWTFALLKGPPYLRARLRGYLWLWQHRSSWLAARKGVQLGRTVDDRQALAAAETELPLAQLVGNAALARWLRRVSRALYSSAPLAPRWVR